MKLSEHFDDTEFKCRCGCGEAKVSSRLISALEELRTIVGKPLIIHSGYRCPEHNKAIGGAVNSQHCLGTAADVRVSMVSPYDLFYAAGKVDAFLSGGIGIAKWGCHVDVRNGVTRWAYDPNTNEEILFSDGIFKFSKEYESVT